MCEVVHILFDTLIAERTSPIINSETRKKLIKTDRFLFFDMGVRRHCANEGLGPTPDRMGQLFKQFKLHRPHFKLKFWKDPDGPEVDWVIDTQDELIPIEVKYAKMTHIKDAQHIDVFLNEHREKAHRGFIILNCDRPHKVNNQVRAVPWSYIEKLEFLSLSKRTTT
jgi:predicted AAA+ superfamily ATPase